jgi:hypothetical protein
LTGQTIPVPHAFFMMRTLSVVAVALGTIGLSWASPASQTRKVVHERRAFVPHGWSHSRKLSPDIVLPMRFGCVLSCCYLHNDDLTRVACLG